SSMDCDKDLFRFREQDWTVSLATTHGRERVELKVGNYQRGKLKQRNPTSAQLCKHRDGHFYLHIQITDEAPDSRFKTSRHLRRVVLVPFEAFFWRDTLT
ncbi:MAG: hypothetical protein RLP14_06955, partial [Owenweeksia sp.]